MLIVLRNTWPLLGGVMLLMIGNGLQGTLLGIRGAIEGFDSFALSLIMSAYFLGFLVAARVTPDLIARVGHVRVFAAFASIISACFILFPAIPNEVAWFVMRIMVGFCFCAVYIVAESWINEAADNETRGKALSAYMIMQLSGIILAQALLNAAPVEGYILFIVISVLVSLSFAPILLSVSPAPVFSTTKRMTLRQLYDTSPLGVMAVLALGMVFSACFGMSGVYGAAMEMSVAQISIFVGAIYVGALATQYPIGWISDRMDRRVLIIAVSAVGAGAGLLGVLAGDWFALQAVAALIFGGMSMPLYSLVLSYLNDYLQHDEMASASGGVLFANGIGAVVGAPLLGATMELVGPWVFFAFCGVVLGAVAVYAVYRSTQRPTPSLEETTPFAPVLPQATPVALEATSEVVIELSEAESGSDIGADRDGKPAGDARPAA
ncbi:MAG: MFS transporter [Pseudomonadota bacterium]